MIETAIHRIMFLKWTSPLKEGISEECFVVTFSDDALVWLCITYMYIHYEDRRVDRGPSHLEELYSKE